MSIIKRSKGGPLLWVIAAMGETAQRAAAAAAFGLKPKLQQ
jgi:hypothetical protein